MHALAKETVIKLERRDLKARAYITPPRLSTGRFLKKIPARVKKVMKTLHSSFKRKNLQFTHDQTDLSVLAALAHLRRVHQARCALTKIELIKETPVKPYIMFGLHMQPESTIDVWAPWLSNQMWVIEWLARSVPPSHKLLVKIHKSDAANYTREDLAKMTSLPSVQLVHPSADAIRLIESAGLIVAIQGTMALEAALLGKPVIMLGDSRTTMLPSVTHCNRIEELAPLIRRKIAEPRPDRNLIVAKFAQYLRPYMPAMDNDWNKKPDKLKVQSLAQMFMALQLHHQRNTKSLTPVN